MHLLGWPDRPSDAGLELWSWNKSEFLTESRVPGFLLPFPFHQRRERPPRLSMRDIACNREHELVRAIMFLEETEHVTAPEPPDAALSAENWPSQAVFSIRALEEEVVNELFGRLF